MEVLNLCSSYHVKTSISTTVIMVNSLRHRFKFNLICRKLKEKHNQKSCRRENRYRIIMLATFSNLTVSDYVRNIKIYTNLPLALQDSCQFYDNIYDITGVTMSLESDNQQDTYLIVSRAYLHEIRNDYITMKTWLACAVAVEYWI